MALILTWIIVNSIMLSNVIGNGHYNFFLGLLLGSRKWIESTVTVKIRPLDTTIGKRCFHFISLIDCQNEVTWSSLEIDSIEIV